MNIIDLEIRQEKDIGLDITSERNITLGINPASGTSNYELLTHKPSIEGVTLIGDKTFKKLGLEPMTEQEIDQMIFGG